MQPSFDPLDPMPAALASNEELVLEWSERAGGSARLAALLNDVVEGGARSPEVMLARLIAVVLAADGRDTLGPADDLWLEHESYCEQHRETWYWLSRAYQQAGRGPASVDALARFLQVGPYAPAAHGRAAGPQHAPAAASEPRVR